MGKSSGTDFGDELDVLLDDKVRRRQVVSAELGENMVVSSGEVCAMQGETRIWAVRCV